MQTFLTSNARIHALSIFAITAVWFAAVALANPTGSFPLNDDWNYARTVKCLLEENKLIITQWSLAASLTHTLTGYLFCLPFGFSFEALRLSSILTGWVATIATYFLCFSTGAKRIVCMLLALVLCCNPIFFDLSLTFMTDVPFITLAALFILTGLPLLSGRARHHNLLLFANTSLAIAMTLLRQTGLVLPVGLWLTEKLWVTKNEKQRLLWLPLVFALVAAALFQFWLAKQAGPLFCYIAEQAYLQQLFAQGPVLVLLSIGIKIIDASVYLGLFTLPALPVVAFQFLRCINRNRRVFAVALAIEVAVLLATGLYSTNSAMPLVDNVFYNLGVGPLLIASGGPSTTPGWPQAPRSAMMALAMLGAACAGILSSILGVILLSQRKNAIEFKSEKTSKAVSFFLIVILLYLGIICVRGFFDRYLLFPMLLILPLLGAATTVTAHQSNGQPESRPIWVAAGLLLASFLWFSIATSHDYLSWNRARWLALRNLTESQKISSLDIDGGLEFNGWAAYEPQYRDRGIVFNASMTHNNAYVIAFAPALNFEIVGTYKFERWLPAGTGRLLVLKRKAP